MNLREYAIAITVVLVIALGSFYYLSTLLLTNVQATTRNVNHKR